MARPSIRLANYLENLDATTNSAVLTEKLADLYEREGKPSSAIDMYERALKLNPSPEQRIRLRLTLGDKLEDQNRDQEAYDNYQTTASGIPGLSRQNDYLPKTFGAGAETQQT